MPNPIVDRAQQWLRDHEADLLADTIAMLKIPSIEGDPLPNAPYGKACRDALDLALQMGKDYGFATKDIEGHIGFCEFGSGPGLILSLGHLDVVPVGPGWKHEPFGAEIDGDYIYARGTTDDKGPSMAAFYAARALKETAGDLGARIRIVFGCNEESGFGCIHRYTKTEEPPTFGIAPDSSWPLVHAEKGIANLNIRVPLNTGEFQVLSLEGGQRANIVIDHCVAKVRVASEARSHVEVKIADSWDRNLTFSWDGDVLTIEAVGKACHGSLPYGGDNAAARALRFLAEASPLSTQGYFEELFWFTHPSGSGLGIHGRDDQSDDLTANLGVVKTVGTDLSMTVNVRYPVTWTGQDLVSKLNQRLSSSKTGAKLHEASDSPPLYFPIDHPMVDAICLAYAEETGDTQSKPGVIGGGTYARAISNTVSVGTSWEGDGLAHETDERIKVEHLFRASRIYARILAELAILAAQKS